MSFSQDVKNEICVLPGEGNNFALLCGMILSAGSLVLSSGGGLSFTVSSENTTFIEFVKKIIMKSYPQAKFNETEQNVNFKQKTRCELAIDHQTGRQILTDLGIISFSKSGNYEINRLGDSVLTIEESDKLDYLKGFFLGAGSISIPEHLDINDMTSQSKTSGYHMEWSVQSSVQADHICNLLAEFDIISRKVERNESYIVYLKEAESISRLLGLFGAHKNLLILENERAGREMRNLVNRQTNCISANIDKSIRAATEQLVAIENIKNTVGLESLSENLQEVALARLTNPEGSLNEIAEVLPVKVSKGAIALRFKKIIEISKEIG